MYLFLKIAIRERILSNTCVTYTETAVNIKVIWSLQKDSTFIQNIKRKSRQRVKANMDVDNRNIYNPTRVSLFPELMRQKEKAKSDVIHINISRNLLHGHSYLLSISAHVYVTHFLGRKKTTIHRQHFKLIMV